MIEADDLKILPIDAFHCLTHFEMINDEYRTCLNKCAYSDAEINVRLSAAGSKFFPSFATSLSEVFHYLFANFGDAFINFAWYENTARLSFVIDDKHFPEGIGNCNMVSLDALSEQERRCLTRVDRNGFNVLLLNKNCRTTPLLTNTNECNLILYNKAEPTLKTVFPGIFAPRMPDKWSMTMSQYIESNDFWNTHCFC